MKLGAIRTASCTIINDDEPGELGFPDDEVRVMRGRKELTLTVQRKNGTSGVVSCKYTVGVEGDTADGELDFVADEGELSFDNQEMEKHIVVKLRTEGAVGSSHPLQYACQTMTLV